MFNALTKNVDIVRVIVETSPTSASRVKWRVKRFGIRKAIGQLAFIAANRVVLVTQRARIEALETRFSLDSSSYTENLVTRVKSINDQKVVELLGELQPDVVVVNGTRLIAPNVLEAAGCSVINTHAGITPRYRGVHGGYWALARGDAANCGVTVHVVDEGVDTGGVLYQARISPDSSDSLNTYPLHQMNSAIPLMRRALRDLEEGGLKVIPGVGPSRQWYHPTICEYLSIRQRKSVR